MVGGKFLIIHSKLRSFLEDGCKILGLSLASCEYFKRCCTIVQIDQSTSNAKFQNFEKCPNSPQSPDFR